MGRKGTRSVIERGISRDGTGYSVRAVVGSGDIRRERERRLPPTLEWPKDAGYIRSQRAQLEADLRDELQQQRGDAPQRGTWAGDVRAYTARVEAHLDPQTFKSRVSELNAWTAAIGEGRSRHNLRATDIDRIIGQWKQAGLSPKTIQNRVRTFRHLYRTLDGKRAKTPADDVQLPARIKTKPRNVDIKTIRIVIANLMRAERRGHLRDSKTRARFLVLVTTGQRPASLKRTTPEDVDLERGIWYVPAAKGGEAVPLPLNSDMLTAWRLFAAAKAWKGYDGRSFARTLRTAGWPAGVRPYNARHSVGYALSERGIDLGDIQPFLGHSQIQTTRAFYVPMLFSRLKAASDRLDKRVDITPRWARYVGTPIEQRRSFGKTRKKAGHA